MGILETIVHNTWYFTDWKAKCTPAYYKSESFYNCYVDYCHDNFIKPSKKHFNELLKGEGIE